MTPVSAATQVAPNRDQVGSAKPKISGEARPSSRLTVNAARSPAYWQAAGVIFHLASNSAIAVAVASCTNWLITRGNVFCAASADQSLRSFTSALIVWTVVFDVLAAATLQGVSLFLAQALSSPTPQRLRLLWCVGILLWRTSHWLVVTVVLCVAVTYAILVGGPSASKWKPYFYFTVMICHIYRSRMILEARSILKSLSSNAKGPTVRHVIVLDSWRRLLPKNISMLLSVYVSIAYVQVATQLDLESPALLFAFSVGSLVIKLALQEMAIHTAMQRKRIRIEQMHAMIAVPTVLIDTQVRILLLRATQLNVASSSRGVSVIQLPWFGSILLAVFEIIVRAGRTWRLHSKISRRWRTRNQPLGHTVRFGSNVIQPSASNAGSVSASSSEVQFQQWKIRRVALHAAEAQADMHAEYIAIGCSLSIYHFCRGHPKFDISIAATPSTSPSSSWLPEVVVFQVVVELVVDFLCTTIEIASGICFEVPRNTGAFLVALYVTCAIGTISISTAMLLVPGNE